jgi:hypothetical protein
MAGTPSAHIKNIKDSSHSKNSPTLARSTEPDLMKREARKSNPFELMQETLRYEKYCKYWSILSNVAAIVSVTGAILSLMRKGRWF